MGQHDPIVGEQVMGLGEIFAEVRGADMFDHPDAGDPVELACDIAVVGERELDLVGNTGRGGAFLGELDLVGGKRNPEHFAAEYPGHNYVDGPLTLFRTDDPCRLLLLFDANKPDTVSNEQYLRAFVGLRAAGLAPIAGSQTIYFLKPDCSTFTMNDDEWKAFLAYVGDKGDSENFNQFASPNPYVMITG